MNILVVDDETVMLDTIKRGLMSKGYRVFGALSAQQALDQLQHGGHRIDMVTTDYLMPAMNGIQLLEAIRMTYPSLPVMIMTAYAQTSVVIEALKNHCDSFIEKPFTLEQLVSEIERLRLNLLRNTRSSDLQQLLPKIVHQINNPLMAISGFAELILMSGGDGDTLQGYAESIIAAVKQISAINKAIMNAGRTVDGKFEPVDMDALLGHCLGMFDGLFTLKDVQVKTGISVQGLRVLGERFALEQVFNNLILNAVDAMDGRLEKTLTVTVTQSEDASSVDVTIEDTGCGIREELMNKIFEPFFTDKRDGNGLGLVVIKNVVENHGGKVFVESRSEVGSKFTVHLPATQIN